MRPTEPPTLTEPALVISGATVFGDHGVELVSEVDLTVGTDEHWGILGANGAGKSTLLSIAGGDRVPELGEVLAFGRPYGASGMHDPRLLVGSLRRGRVSFAGGLTVEQVVALPGPGSAALRGATARHADPEEIRAKLDLFGCGRMIDRRFADCSQGERQRVLLARGMMRKPALFFLDEPAAALDIVGREHLLHALARLVREGPELATVAAVHGPEELPATTSHVALLKEGRVLAAGPIDEVLTAELLSECYGVVLNLHRIGERWAVEVPATERRRGEPVTR